MQLSALAHDIDVTWAYELMCLGIGMKVVPSNLASSRGLLRGSIRNPATMQSLGAEQDIEITDERRTAGDPSTVTPAGRHTAIQLLSTAPMSIRRPAIRHQVAVGHETRCIGVDGDVA
jgi:hypothetical protein